jgi:hypothetical protein
VISSQRTGNRYLAGLVIAFSFIYLGLTSARAALGQLSFGDLALLGALPAAIAFLLGLRAWRSTGNASPFYSAIALMVLITGLALSRLALAQF